MESIDSCTPTALWDADGQSAGITRREFREYFCGAERAYALMLSAPLRLESMHLTEVRRWRCHVAPTSEFLSTVAP